MTRKDYQLIADVIRNSRSATDGKIIPEVIVGELANAFGLSSPRFDPAWFAEAAGIKTPTGE